MSRPFEHARGGRSHLRRVRGLVVASTVALLALVLVSSSRGAIDVGLWQSQLLRDADRLGALEEQRDGSEARLEVVRDDRQERWRDLRGRLASLYKAGGHSPLRMALIRGGSMGEVATTANIVAAVAKQDQQAIREYRDVVNEERTLVRKLGRLRAQVRSTRSSIAKDRRVLRREIARLKALEERARALAAAAPPSPIATRAVSPQGVAAGLAGSASGPAGYVQTGVASMYHDDFSGEETATGELYSPGAMTAAHPSLPLGTWVAVRGPGGSALVKINDRGPFVGGRIIDLSRAAADAVGLGGLATVTITVP